MISARVKLCILGLLLILGFVFSFQGVRGSEINFQVDHVATKLEKLKEKLTLLMKFNQIGKANFYQYLLEKRLAELSFVVKDNDINSVEETASRYSTYLGILVNYVENKTLHEKKGELDEIFARHSEILIDLQKKFEFESGWWLALQHDINTISLFKDKLKNL